MLPKMRSIGSLLIFSLFLFSCKKEEKNSNIPPKKINTEEIQKNENITSVISTDLNKLGKIIDLTKFKPLNVKYKYVFIDNSNGRIAGPSDTDLEAVLYFDNKTMKKIKDIDLAADFPEQNFEKKEFKFDWLDEKIVTELENSEKKSAHLDFLFGTNNGKLWYLKDKILMKLTTN